MSRGRYKSAAEARQVREGALSEVEAGRRQIVRLAAENKELRETLASERQVNTARLRELNALVAEGSAPELAALRGELSDLRSSIECEKIARAKRVVKLLADTPWIEIGGRTHIQMAEALGVKVGDLFPETTSRRLRRMTSNTANLGADVRANPWLVV